MNTRRLLIGLLLLAHGSLALASLAAAWGPDRSGIASASVWILPAVQMGLLGIWLALGRLASPWRLLIVLGAVVAWSDALARLFGSWGPRAADAREEWIWPFLAQVIATALPLLIARAAGMQLISINAGPEGSGPAHQHRRLQFSIGYLLAWTTALAIVMSVLSYLTSFEDLDWHMVVGWRYLAYYGKQATIAIAAFWVVLGTWRLPGRIYVFVLTWVLVTGGFSWLIRWQIGGLSFHEARYVIDAPLLVGSLVVVRAAGYRLQWRRQTTEPVASPRHRSGDEQQ